MILEIGASEPKVLLGLWVNDLTNRVWFKMTFDSLQSTPLGSLQTGKGQRIRRILFLGQKRSSDASRS